MSNVSLNEKQLEAIRTTGGPLLILAGAGAGKTKTITERVLQIVKEGTEPHNILCITFTNKAANEMREKIVARLREEKLIENIWENQPIIKTFHSLGLSILKEFGSHFGYTKNLTVLDPSDTNSIIKNILEKLSLDPKLHDASKIKNAISREKGNFQTPDDYAKKVSSFNMETIEKIWRLYEKELLKQKSVDFDDLIIQTVKLLREKTEIKEYYQKKFKYVHIDEYQDTNEAQYEFTKILVNPALQNICVVGDADQNIYSWRGANLKNILNFEKDFEGTKIVLLEENYRSTNNILSLANISIKKNKARKEKNLFTRQANGEEIEVTPCWEENSEADFIAKKCQELIKKNKVNPKEICILFRANFQSRVLEEAMLENGVPYQMLGTKFFERKEIKDAMSYLRAAMNLDSLNDLKRVFETPKKGIGKTSVAKIFAGQFADLNAGTQQKINNVYLFLAEIRKKIECEENKLSEVIKFITEKSGLEKELKDGNDEDKEKLENIYELVTITQKFDNKTAGQALGEFLEEVSLKSDQDSLSDEALKKENRVRLMTIHASKGLEFDYVFITGLEMDLFPHKNIGGRKRVLEEEEEERRLFYVAVTRAKKKLFLTFAELRTIYGQKQINTPSEFLDDLNGMKEDKIIYHDTYKKDYSESKIIQFN